MVGQKTGYSQKVDRYNRRIEAKGKEDAQKGKVRRRDRFCRLPFCGCRKFNLQAHVSHSKHRGMGGNPKGDRSSADLMILVCSARHKELPISIDRGTLRWRPLTAEGSNGPVLWEADRETLVRVGLIEPKPNGWTEIDDGWLELAREKWIQQLDPSYPPARVLLERMAAMTT